MGPQLRFRKVIYLLGTLLAAGLGLAVLLLSMPVAASDQFVSASATVWLDGPEGDIYVGDEITVTVRISDVTDLYGIDLGLVFTATDMEVLDADGAKPGVQIATAECPEPDFQVKNVVSNTAGTIEYVVTQLNPTPPVSGDCSVAHIRFKALQEASTMVSFAGLILSDRDFGEIAADTVDLALEIKESGDYYIHIPYVIGKPE